MIDNLLLFVLFTVQNNLVMLLWCVTVIEKVSKDIILESHRARFLL